MLRPTSPRFQTKFSLISTISRIEITPSLSPPGCPKIHQYLGLTRQLSGRMAMAPHKSKYLPLPRKFDLPFVCFLFLQTKVLFLVNKSWTETRSHSMVDGLLNPWLQARHIIPLPLLEIVQTPLSTVSLKDSSRSPVSFLRQEPHLFYEG